MAGFLSFTSLKVPFSNRGKVSVTGRSGEDDAACALPLTVCVHAQLLFFFFYVDFFPCD